MLGTGERLKTQALDVILEATSGAPVHSVIQFASNTGEWQPIGCRPG